jgi:hypothetical protein
MAKKQKAAKKAEKRTRILGVAVSGTTKGNVLSKLLDGKWHSLEDLKECRIIDRDSIGWRLTLLQKSGKWAERPFKLDIEDDRVRLVFTGKSKANGDAKKTNGDAMKHSAKSASGKVHPAARSRASVEDVPVEDDDE